MPDNYSSLPTLTQRDLQDPTLFRFNSVMSQILNELLALRSAQQQVSAKTAAIESLVAPEGVGRQTDTSFIPGDVRPIGGQPFLIAQVDLPGGEKAFDIEYDPPDPIGVFAGVYVVVTAPSVGGTDYFPGGDFQYNGDSAAGDATRHGTLRVVMPTPAVPETWRFYLVSYATDYRKAFYHFDEVLEIPSPNRTFAVTPAPQPAGSAMPDAETILDATAAVEYGVQENRDGTRTLLYHIKGDLTLRLTELGEIADAYYLHTRVFCYEVIAGVEQEPEEIAWGEQSYDGRWHEARNATFRLKFVSTNKENRDNPVPFTLVPDVVVEAMPALPAITASSYELQRQVINSESATPSEEWRLVGSWTQAPSSYQWYVKLQLLGTAGADVGRTIRLGEVGEPQRDFIAGWYPQGASSTYQLQLVRVNRLEQEQPAVDVGAPFTVAPMDDAPAIVGPVVSMETADLSTDAGLVRKYRFKGSWARGVGDAYWFTRVSLLPQPAGAAMIIAEEQDAFQTDWFDIGAPATYKVQLKPVNWLRRESAAQAPAGDPVFSISGISEPGNVDHCAVAVKTQAVDRATGRVKQWAVNLKWDLPADTTDFGWCQPVAVFEGGYEAKFTGEETEAPAHELGIDSSWFDLTELIRFRVEFRTYNIAGDMVASPPTFPTPLTYYELSPEGTYIPPATAPGDVTPGVPEYTHLGGGKTEIRAPFTAPVGDANFVGVLLEIENPDQSALPTAQIDGSTLWDGSVMLAGDQKPISQQFTYDAGSPRVPAITIDSPTYQITVRVRWRSCSASVTNPDGPSATLVILPPGVDKPQAANAYCEMATWGVSPAAASAPYDLNGQLDQDIVFSTIVPPSPVGSYSGWEIWSSGWPDDPEVYLHTGPMNGDRTTVTVKCPKTLIGVRFWLRSFSNAADGTVQRNPLVPGVTPSVIVNLGTATGTLNAGEILNATLSASLRVINKVLGVPTSGITEELISVFAVSQTKLADAAVATAKIQDLSVITGKLAALATDTSKLADLAVQAGKLDNLAVLTGKLADLAVQSTKLDNLSVLTGKLADLAATASKLGTASVTETKIDNLAVGNAAIKDLAATSAKLADAAVESAKIANLAVGSAAIADLAATAAKLADAAVESAKIKNLAVGNAAIALLAVGTAHMQDAAITNLKLGALAVSTANIQDLAVSTAKIQSLAITNALIANLAVNDAKIQNVSIGKLTAGSVSLTDFLTITNGVKTIKLDTTNWIKMTDAGSKWCTSFANGYLNITKTDDATALLNLYPFMLQMQYTTNVYYSVAAVPWSSGVQSQMSLNNASCRFDVYLPAMFTGGSTRICLDGVQVLTTRQAAIPSPVGGAIIDSEARTCINAIRAALQSHGLTY